MLAGGEKRIAWCVWDPWKLALGSAAADGSSRAQCFRALVASERALRHSMPETKCLRKSKVGAGTVLSVDQAKRALWLQDWL